MVSGAARVIGESDAGERDVPCESVEEPHLDDYWPRGSDPQSVPNRRSGQAMRRRLPLHLLTAGLVWTIGGEHFDGHSVVNRGREQAVPHPIKRCGEDRVSGQRCQVAVGHRD